jgi:two-component system sensor histidine kinase KdpD
MSKLIRNLRKHAFAATCVVVSTTFACLVHPYGHLADLAMIHLLGIVFLSLRSSVRASVVASVLSILAFDYFSITPRWAFAWQDWESSLTFAAMLLVSVVVSTLSQNLRHQEQAARATAFRAESLYELNVELSSSRDIRQLSAVTARHLHKLFAAKISILLQAADGSLEPAESSSDDAGARKAWIHRVLTVQHKAPNSVIWVPVLGAHSTLGVIGLELGQPFAQTSDHGFLLQACANQFATAVERVQLASAARRNQLEAEGERLRSSLLSAVSHDLKTPLATMIAAGNALIRGKGAIAAEVADGLLRSMVSEGERLHRLIHNLLSVTRLESATVELRRTPEAIDDIVLSAVERFSGRPGRHRIVADLAPDLPLISAEPLLLEQVLSNLIENATRHAGAAPAITVQARAGADGVVVQVADNGPGIAEHERDKVFEKFYRGQHTTKSDGGVGLGLTICRAIVRAHGGQIRVQERAGGGTLVEFTVPLAAHAQSLALEASSIA